MSYTSVELSCASDEVRFASVEAGCTAAQAGCANVEAGLASLKAGCIGIDADFTDVEVGGAEFGHGSAIGGPRRTDFARVPNRLVQLQPCLMVSPLAVSTSLESPEFPFDIVIFDEASQVLTFCYKLLHKQQAFDLSAR